MASSLVVQLSQIAEKSTNPLDLKAQRVAHSQSLIFEKKIAIDQDFDTIYQISYQGFRELCLLDARFAEFDRTIFSEESKGKDRSEMTASQNEELDAVLESFLALVGSKLLLNPAIKAIEWLVRRFRVHEFNTSFLLLTFLPYHMIPIFLNLLEIIPEELTPTFKVLYPYKRSLINPPRHPLVHSVTTNKSFCSALNQYVLQVCRQQAGHHALLAFWAGVMTEALAGMLESSRSGRRDIERQNHEDILLRFLPVLKDGLGMKKASELVIGCYMLTVVLAKMTALEIKVLDSFMDAVVVSWTHESITSGIICLSILAQQKNDIRLPKRVTRAVLRLENVMGLLAETAGQHSISQLVLGLISGCLDDIRKQKGLGRLEFVISILDKGILDESQTRRAMSLILQTFNDVSTNDDLSSETQTHLAEFIQKLNESDSLRPHLQVAAAESTTDIESLEYNLQTMIEKEPTALATEDIEMESAEKESNTDQFVLADQLTGESLHASSFLSTQRPYIFDKLAEALGAAVGSQERLERFSNLPILGKDHATSKPQFLTFFTHVFSGPYPIGTRAAAMGIMTSFLSSGFENGIDIQALIPYLIAALTDPSKRIRRDAAGLLAAVAGLYRKGGKSNIDDDAPWARDSFYPNKESKNKVQWLSGRDARKVIDRVLLPSLEEYVLDPNQVFTVIEAALRGSARSETASDLSSAELKKSLRIRLFSFLCSHLIHIPIFAVKLRLLKLLNSVEKVGSTTVTGELQPLLEKWRTMTQEEVDQISENENISALQLDKQIVATITPKEKEAVNILVSNVSTGTRTLRPAFIAATFDHLKHIWPKLREEKQLLASEKLLELSFVRAAGGETLRSSAKDVLRNIELPGGALLNYTDKIPELIAKLETRAPSPKRRRINSINTRNQAELGEAMDIITFVLELVDSSVPETHPELAGGLFRILAALHNLKSQLQSGFDYLLTLTLGSLLVIVKKSKFDPSTIRTDLVVECIRTTESPQVQNTALLLVSRLAVVAPELVLHSVMPIFTFMGSNVLRKDDEYSIDVIDQTINQVVPALVQSLRKQKRDVVSGTSELLLSFIAAFEHIPSHRRHRLFETLITRLGAHDFLFAVLAMLGNRHVTDKDVLSLMCSIASNNPPEMQLITYEKYLDLVNDCLKPKPGISKVLFGIGNDEGGNPQKIAENLLRSLAYVLRHSSLGTKMLGSFTSNELEKSAELRSLYSRILELILSLSEPLHNLKPLSQACEEVLSSLLSILSLVDFLDAVEALLQRPQDELRRKVLRLLDNRLRDNPARDSRSRQKVLDFLAILLQIIKSSPDALLKHAAVACVDRITETYGRADPAKLEIAAVVIASEACIGQSDDRICVMSLLCLASLTEVLGQRIIPALPDALNRSLRLLEIGLERYKENAKLHDAVFSLLSVFFEHVPFMISDKYLDSILQLSFRSASSSISTDSHDCRRETMTLLARRVDVKESFGAIERNWSTAVQEGPIAAKEALNVVGLAIEKHPKSSTVNNVEILSKLLHKTFDLRREQVCIETGTKYEPSELEDVENSINTVAIQMTYKLNDTIFRPFFVELVEWATNGLPKNNIRGKTMRLTTFYKFLQNFFGTLKSIVTSYASYVIENVAEVLITARPNDNDSKSLWLAAIRMLRGAFEHDQDEFWQSPSHFSAISNFLISQLSHATNASTAAIVISEAVPTITEFAVAADSPDNYKELNSSIMKLFRPSLSATVDTNVGGENPHTRVAALKAEQALTERLGEEWLALLPEMLPYISELMEDEDETVEKEVRKWVKLIEDILGEKLDDMLM